VTAYDEVIAATSDTALIDWLLRAVAVNAPETESLTREVLNRGIYPRAAREAVARTKRGD
jgi:hypothetical protein